jgi:hypothetical protein
MRYRHRRGPAPVIREPKTEMSAAEYRGEGTEAAWRITVEDEARKQGWMTLLALPDAGLGKLWQMANRPDSRVMAFIPLLAALSGWPDLTLGHPEKKQIIFVELKSKTGTVRENQKKVLELLMRCGARVYIWRTGDPTMLSILSGE